TTRKSGAGASGRLSAGRWHGGPICWAARRSTTRNAIFFGNYRTEGMMGAIELVEKTQLTERPAMKSGDTVRVHVKVREGDKERIQVFEGVVIGQHRGGTRASFTVRKVSFGQGVERICALHS